MYSVPVHAVFPTGGGVPWDFLPPKLEFPPSILTDYVVHTVHVYTSTLPALPSYMNLKNYDTVQVKHSILCIHNLYVYEF